MAGKTAGAIQRKQIGSFIKLKLFECFSPLQRTKDIPKDWSNCFGVNRVENFSHRRVTRNIFDVKDGSQIMSVVFVVSSAIKGEQRRIFQRKYRKGRHQKHRSAKI